MVICLCSVYNLVILFSNSFVAIISEFSIENMQWNWDLRIFFCVVVVIFVLLCLLNWIEHSHLPLLFEGKSVDPIERFPPLLFIMLNEKCSMLNWALFVYYTHTHYILVGLSLVLFLFGWYSRFQFDSFQQNFSLTIFAFYSRIILFSTVVILPPKTPK